MATIADSLKIKAAGTKNSASLVDKVTQITQTNTSKGVTVKSTGASSVAKSVNQF